MRAVVVGAGVMGAASAWRLARRGVDVTLVEQFELGHARGASHGSARIFRHAYDDDLYTSLAVAAGQLWDELDASSADDPVLTRTGAVDHGPSAVTVSRAAGLDRVGLRYEILDCREARKRWPGMRFDSTVLFHPNAGRLHADRAVASLTARARECGAHVRSSTAVTAVRADGDGVTVETDRGPVHADRVVVAAGAWTGHVVGNVCGAELPALRTTQEQPAHFAPAADVRWPSFVHHPGGDLDEAEHVGGIYGLASADGIKIGEHATGPEVTPGTRDYRPDPAGETRLREYAARWLPGVDASSAVSTTCLYTCTPDHNFVVDRRDNLTVAAGFSGHGFKFAPAIGEYVADLVTEVAMLPVTGLPRLFGFGQRVA